jgi:hypothetical protein
MLDYGAAGRLISPGQPEELAFELRRLMLDREARQDLRQSALRGSQVFDVERLLRDYEQVYRSVAKRTDRDERSLAGAIG